MQEQFQIRACRFDVSKTVFQGTVKIPTAALFISLACLFQGREINNSNEDNPKATACYQIKCVQVVEINTSPPEFIESLGESFPQESCQKSL